MKTSLLVFAMCILAVIAFGGLLPMAVGAADAPTTAPACACCNSCGSCQCPPQPCTCGACDDCKKK